MTHGAGGSQPPWDGPEYPPQHYDQQYPPEQPWEPQRYDARDHQERMRRRQDEIHQVQQEYGQPQRYGQPYQPQAPQDYGQPWQSYGQQSPPQQPPSPPQRRRRSRTPLYAGLAILVLAGAGGAAYALVGGSSKPLTCQQQYDNWRNGAGSLGQDIKSEGTALEAAGNSEDVPAMDDALKKLGDTAAQLKSHPMPACADPHGYWPQMLAYFKAAGDNAASSSGLGGLMLAMDPAKKAVALSSKIDAELKAAHVRTAS